MVHAGGVRFCGLWFVGCGLWFVGCGLWFAVCGLWFAVCGLRFVVLHLTCGKARACSSPELSAPRAPSVAMLNPKIPNPKH